MPGRVGVMRALAAEPAQRVESNFKALFESIEEDQIQRGVIGRDA
jgi:hypothetical protein